MISSLLLSVIQEPAASTHIAGILAVLTTAVTGTVVFSKKQKRLFRKAALKHAWQKLWKGKPEKGSGALFIAFLLLLIAGVAVLWILWELAGWFGLIAGIVAGLMFLGLVFGKN